MHRYYFVEFLDNFQFFDGWYEMKYSGMWLTVQTD